MGTEYEDAPEVRAIAAELIPTHHRHLIGVRFEFVFVDPPGKSHGKVQLGSARKVSGLYAHLADWGEDAFVVTIARSPWRSMSRRAKEALVDHELSHCAVDDEGALHTRGHDVDDFADVLRRHGLWRAELQEFGRVAAEQLRLTVVEAAS